MTVLVGVKYPNGLIFGSDRLGVYNKSQRKDVDKIFFNKYVAVGVTGRFIDSVGLLSNLRLENKISETIESLNYESVIEKTLSFFKALDEGMRESAIKNKDRVGLDMDIKGIHMSFLFALRYSDDYHLMYSDFGLSLEEFLGGGSSLTGSVGSEESFDAAGSKDDAFDIVKEYIGLANSVYPQYCSGLEIISLEDGDSKRLFYEKPVL